MKNFLPLVIATAALSMSASAATITANCSAFPIQFTGSVGNGSVSCPGFSVAGGTLTGASLALVADYTFGNIGVNNDILLTFSVGAPIGVNWASTSVDVHSTGQFNSSSTTPPIPVNDLAVTGVSNAAFASAFNVGVSSSVVSGGAGTSSAGVSITYIYNAATPEPGSIALLGSGLIGLALAGRKRFGQ